MTLDYHIVLPMILAVAAGLGVRRALSRENIYTAKLVGRGHVIPKALHANMFLVRRHAKDVMEREFLLVAAETGLDEFLRQPDHHGGMRHVVVTRGDRIVGVVRINTGLRTGIADLEAGVTLGDVANHHVHHSSASNDDVAFDVIVRLQLARRNGVMAVVVRDAAPAFMCPGRPTSLRCSHQGTRRRRRRRGHSGVLRANSRGICRYTYWIRVDGRK